MVSTWELIVISSVIWLPMMWFIGFMLFEAYKAGKREKPDPIPLESMFEVKTSDCTQDTGKERDRNV